MSFNPNEHLMDLKGKSYLQVPWRLAWINDDLNQGAIGGFIIETDEVYDREFENARRKMTDYECKYRTIVKVLDREGNVVKQANATGTCTRSEFSLYNEKAETKSVGRALAMVGYGTQNSADDFDMGDAPSPITGQMEPSIVDSPVRKAPAGRAPAKAAPKQPPAKPAPNASTGNAVEPEPEVSPAKQEALAFLQTQVSTEVGAKLLNEAVQAYKTSNGMSPSQNPKVSDLSEETLVNLASTLKDLSTNA